MYVCSIHTYVCTQCNMYVYILKYTKISTHTNTQRKKIHSIRKERGDIITDPTDINKCYGLNVCVSPKYTEIPPPSEMVGPVKGGPLGGN